MGSSPLDLSEFGGQPVQPTPAAPAQSQVSSPLDLSEFGGQSVKPVAPPAAAHQQVEQPGPVTRGLSEFETSSGLPPSSVGDYMRNLHEGGAYLVTHPLDSVKMLGKSMLDAQSDQASQAYEAYKKGDYPAAVARALYSGIPIAGPILAHAADRIQAGDYAGAAGAVLAVALPGTLHSLGPVGEFSHVPGEVMDKVNAKISAARAPKPAPEVSPEVVVQTNKDIRQAIPASKATPYTEGDLDVGRKYLEPHHENVQPIRSVEDFRDASNHEIGNIEDRVNGYIGVVPKDPIGVNVLDEVRSELSDHPRGQEFVNAGLRELEGFEGFKQGDKLTIADADRIRKTLNAENKNVLSTKTNPDVAAIRESDPAFRAREVASEALRNAIYDRLEARGIEGVRNLRLDEGSLIRLRNAAEAQIYRGEKVVRGTGEQSMVRNIAAKSAKALGTAGGGAAGGFVAGPIGAGISAVAGHELGSVIADKLAPTDLSRDALVERSFKNKIATSTPQYPAVNLRAVPEAAPIGQQELLTNPSTMFDVSQTQAPAFRPGVPGTALAKIPGSTPTTHIPSSPFGIAATEGIKTPPPVVEIPVRQLPAAKVENVAPAKSGDYRTVGVVRVGPKTYVAPPESQAVSIGGEKVGSQLVELQRVLDDRNTPDTVKSAAHAQMKKLIDASKAATTKMIQVEDSLGNVHEIPKSALEEAKKKDPKLKIMEGGK